MTYAAAKITGFMPVTLIDPESHKAFARQSSFAVKDIERYSGMSVINSSSDPTLGSMAEEEYVLMRESVTPFPTAETVGNTIAAVTISEIHQLDDGSFRYKQSIDTLRASRCQVDCKYPADKFSYYFQGWLCEDHALPTSRVWSFHELRHRLLVSQGYYIPVERI